MINIDTSKILNKFSQVKSDSNVIKNRIAKMYEYYFGEATDLPKYNRRSNYVVKEVTRVVESVMPDLMRIFTSGLDYVTITPRGAEDDVAARLLHEKINYDIMVENNGFEVLHDAIKDALICYGVIKYGWAKKKNVVYKRFEKIKQNELESLLFAYTSSGVNYEIVEYEIVSSINGIIKVENANNNVLTGTQPEVVTNTQEYVNVTIKIVEEYGAPVIQAIPPEDVIFDYTSTDITKAFFAHRIKINKKEAVLYGINSNALLSNTESNYDIAKSTRNEKIMSEYNIIEDKDIVEIWEIYWHDYDEKGDILPYKCIISGNKIVKAPEINVYGRPPFVVCSAIRVGHTLIGRGLAEMAKESHDLKTVLFRYMLDNIYFQNNGRYIINPRAVIETDLINNNVPGGVIRTRDGANPSEAIMPVMPAPIAPQFFNIWNISDLQSQQEHGVGDYMQGFDSKTLNKTATGVTQILNRSMQRVELIARVIAETMLKDLVMNMIDMEINFMDRELNIKIDEDWLNITPESIKGKYGKYDVIVDIGSSTGMREYKINQLIMLIQTMVNQLTLQLGVVDAEKIANLFRAVIQMMGWKNVDKFVNDVSKMQQQMPTQPQFDVNMLQQLLANGGINNAG